MPNGTFRSLGVITATQNLQERLHDDSVEDLEVDLRLASLRRQALQAQLDEAELVRRLRRAKQNLPAPAAPSESQSTSAEHQSLVPNSEPASFGNVREQRQDHAFSNEQSRRDIGCSMDEMLDSIIDNSLIDRGVNENQPFGVELVEAGGSIDEAHQPRTPPPATINDPVINNTGARLIEDYASLPPLPETPFAANNSDEFDMSWFNDPIDEFVNLGASDTQATCGWLTDVTESTTEVSGRYALAPRRMIHPSSDKNSTGLTGNLSSLPPMVASDTNMYFFGFSDSSNHARSSTVFPLDAYISSSADAPLLLETCKPSYDTRQADASMLQDGELDATTEPLGPPQYQTPIIISAGRLISDPNPTFHQPRALNLADSSQPGLVEDLLCGSFCHQAQRSWCSIWAIL